MADELPSPQEIGAASWPHDWYPYEEYQVIHHTFMNRLINEGLVEDDELTFREYRKGRQLLRVNITGRIHCTRGVTVEVNKWLDVRRTRRGYEVVGSSYIYQAWFEADGREILRYDSTHGMNALHYHLFDLRNGDESVVGIELSELPTLDGYIRQAIRIAEDAEA